MLNKHDRINNNYQIKQNNSSVKAIHHIGCVFFCSCSYEIF